MALAHVLLVASVASAAAERGDSLIQGGFTRDRTARKAEAAEAVGPIGFLELPGKAPRLPRLHGLGPLLVETEGAAVPAHTLELLKAYRPCAACKKPTRVGSQHDGGYVMCDELLNGTLAAYSYGIQGNDAWGAAISNRLRVPVRQYDCFNTSKPACPEGMTCNFQFHSECVGLPKSAGKTFKSLKEQMAANGDVATNGNEVSRLLMKMDVEGSEWDILGNPANRPLLRQFSQIVLELHATVEPVQKRLEVMQGMLRDFVVVHIHGNNCCGSVHAGAGLSIPSFLEVTFVRRGLLEEAECSSDPEVSDLDKDNLDDQPSLERPHLPL